MRSQDQAAAEQHMSPGDGKKVRWPPQIKFIIGNEACERFSYYGIRSILALYISQMLFQHLPAGEAKDRATEIIHLFIFANYFTPLLGAWLSDKFWGRYYTILYVSLIYCLGNLILAFGVGTTWGLYVGLAFIAIGSGGIKPCVSAFCGDQFRPDQSSLLQKAFGLFYWSINFGSFFSFLLIPWLKDGWGYRVAFGVPGGLMLLATLIFWLGRKHYTRVPPSSETKSAGFMKVTWFALSNWGQKKPGQSIWDVARQRFTEKEVNAASSVGPILAVFAPITIFWALFDQTSSTWVMQGSKMIPLSITNTYKLGAEQMQFWNPAFVMLLVPLMLWLYPKVERLLNIRVSPLRRMGFGMLLASLSYIFVGVLQTRVDANVQMSILYQVLPYFVITVAEVLISTTGLEFAFTQAAPEMKSTITSFWLLTVAIGNLWVSLITKIQAAFITSGSAAVNASTFYLYAIMMFIGAIAFVIISMRYKERELQMTSGTK